jgi:hypothetical protein
MADMNRHRAPVISHRFFDENQRAFDFRRLFLNVVTMRVQHWLATLQA